MSPPSALLERVIRHLAYIYGDNPDGFEIPALAKELLTLMRLPIDAESVERFTNHWSQHDTYVITYGDTFLSDTANPLATLKLFLDDHSDGLLTGVHVLPFYPWSSDDGFAVLDYSSVNEALGDWEDIKACGL